MSEVTTIQNESMQGMFLTFNIGTVGYGIEICHVIEIIGIQQVTNIPDMPEYLIGIINLRGKVIPVIDVRLRFGMEERAYDDRTCIIVVSLDDNLVGLVVDKVSEVVTIPAEQIEPQPRLGGNASHYTKGLGKIGDQVRILLNVGALLDETDGIEPPLDKAV